MADNALMSFLQDTFTRTADPSPERSKTSNLKQNNYVPEAVSDVAQRIATNPAVLKSALVHMPEVIGASALNTLAVQPAVEAGRNAKFIADYASSPASFAKVLGHQEDGTPILDDPSKPLPPSDQNVSQFALDVGMAGLGTSFAGGAPRGAIGMFAGPKAKSWQSSGLNDLYDLVQKNDRLSASAQFKKTGYFVDSQNGEPIRLIIPEDSARVNTQALMDVIQKNKSVNAQDILHYPELFSEYPDLKDLRVKPYYDRTDGGGAYFDTSKWEVGLNQDDPIFLNAALRNNDGSVVTQMLGHEIAGHGVDVLERRPYVGSSRGMEEHMLEWNNKPTTDEFLIDRLYRTNPGEISAEIAGDIATNAIVRDNAVRIPNYKEAKLQEYELLKMQLGLPSFYGKR